MTDNQTINETMLQTAVEIIPGAKKNVILDSQILTALMNCPRLADFRFNLNLISIGGKSNSLECGSIVHKFLEVYYGSIINGLKKSDAINFGMAAAELYIRGCIHCTDFSSTFCNAYADSPDKQMHLAGCTICIAKPPCNHKPNDYPGVKNTPPEPNKEDPREKYKIGWKWVLETCTQYADHYKSDHWVPLEVETVKGKILYEDDEIRVLWKSKLDLISDTNQGIYPIDHKTMKQRRDNLSLNNQFMGQCVIMNTRNVFINKIGFQTTLKPEEKFERKTLSYSAQRLMEWQSEILPYYAKLLLMYAETGYYPPNFTNCENKYGKCAFVKVCEANPDMREEELKKAFMVGPEWNPTNDDEGGED